MNTRRQVRWGVILVVTLAVVALLAALVGWLNVRGESRVDPSRQVASSSELVKRGAYLARAGNCMGCHTTADGQAYAGGRGVETPFGVVYAPNITPEHRTGIGGWSADTFWRAMHHGRSQDGRLLYPAFPYPSYTLVTRQDSDALYAYLRSVPAVVQENKAHELRFPYNTQIALALWRAVYFRPAEFKAEPARSAQWNRGKYLVQGLGHCAACHSPRNFLGGIARNAEFAGGLMPDESWYAPSLASVQQAGVQGWTREEVVQLLKDGVSSRAAVAGPMADVVYTSTQHLSTPDLDAMAQYLTSIPAQPPERKEIPRASSDVLALGSKLYEQHCTSCHGAKGEGVQSIYPPLAGNRAVLLDSPNNLVQVIRRGGFPPTTAGNPQPFGMPPFRQLLNDEEIAAVTTFIRQAWGHAAAPVTPLAVHRVK
nr:cytochrome c [uncultured Caldimonas sp.]